MQSICKYELHIANWYYIKSDAVIELVGLSNWNKLLYDSISITSFICVACHKFWSLIRRNFWSFRASLDKNGRDVDYFLKGLKNLGKLYDHDASETMDDLMEFQRILNKLDQDFDAAAKLKAVSIGVS